MTKTVRQGDALRAMLVAQGTLTAKDVRASHGNNYDCREKNGKMSTVVTQLRADYIVTAEREGDRVMGNARRRNKNVL